MSDAPERIWASPEHPDEDGYGGFWIKARVLPAVEYIRADLVPAVDVAGVRARVAAAIFDPGETEGYKGERTLTEWQVDAVMRALIDTPAADPLVAAMADRIEALTEQLEAARADAKEAEAYADELAGDQVDLCRQLIAAEDKLAQATWLLTEAAVQLEEGKIKTRRNRAAIIWNLLDEMKAEIEGGKP